MPEDADNGQPTPFERIVESLDYPLFVVSAAAGEDVAACLVGFATQCSIEPARFQVCLSKSNRTYEVARRGETIVVHRIRRDQQALAEHFGGTSARDDPDKLCDWPWTPGPQGAPIVDDCDWFAGRILDRFDTGDHMAFVLAPFGGMCREAEQLGYQDASEIDPGQPAGKSSTR
jgi:flavin reductase (DIM6/NTAB) family NADH-FMN oxidoreductase RutF